jgi:hypothetical protein
MADKLVETAAGGKAGDYFVQPAGFKSTDVPACSWPSRLSSRIFKAEPCLIALVGRLNVAPGEPGSAADLLHHAAKLAPRKRIGPQVRRIASRFAPGTGHFACASA